MIPRRITSNMGNPKFGLRGGQRLKLRQKWDGCPLRFWPLEQRDGTVNSFHATCTRCLKQKKKKKTSKPFLATFRWPQVIDL